MTGRLVIGMVCALAASAGGGGSTAAAAAKHPTRTEIGRAIRAAERSSDLWATVNICDTRKYPHTLGVRGQMPALGFAADLRMTFELDYFSQPHRRFEPLRGVADPIDLGTAARGIYQDGVRFDFRPHAGALRGRVIFTWRLGRRTIGRVTKLTTAGHHGARFGDPRGYSRASCAIS